MRKFFVLVVIAIFAAYCVAAYHSYTYVAVPSYETVEVDLLGGRTWSAWEKDEPFQREQLAKLARAQYHPTARGLATGSDNLLPPDKALTEADLQAVIRNLHAATGGNIPRVELRDPAAILALAGEDLELRDPLPKIKFGDEYLTKERVALGVTLTKELFDILLKAGMKRVAVVGKGQPVAPQAGTMLMVGLIFLGLVAALKGTLWGPLLALIDSRREDLERGKILARENRVESEHLENEAKALRAKNRREYLAQLAAAQRQAYQEADAILQEARDKVQALRDEATAEMEKEVHAAEEKLRQEIPTLAQAMVEKVLGRSPRA